MSPGITLLGLFLGSLPHTPQAYTLLSSSPSNGAGLGLKIGDAGVVSVTQPVILTLDDAVTVGGDGYAYNLYIFHPN